MKPFKSLGRQIITAYILFTVACCLLFIAIGAFVVEGIEVRLVDDRLKEVAAWAAPRYAGGLPVEMPTGLSFHHGESIPASLRAIEEGVQEVNVDGVGLHVLGGHTAAGAFVVIDHESDYNQVEAAVYSLIGMSFIGFLGLSLLLGRFMARRFVSPIVDLAVAVTERRHQLPLLDTNNEVGVLARAFDGYAKEMKHYLDRERFFTGDVSHELRTPLTIIGGAVEIIALATATEPHLKGPVERINRALSDATGSVTVLLMLARSPHLIESEEISAGELAHRCVAQHQYLVAQKKVECRFDGGDFQVRLPPKLLDAALGNLIRNACTYTDHGAVIVSIVERKIRVQDTGAGLPPAVLAMLRGDQTSLHAGSAGTGLGLALVMRICEHIGATLRVVAASDHGTVIEIDFLGTFTKI